MKRLKLLIIAALFLALAVANPAVAPHNSKISGYKWHDQNADGVWDASEPPLEGWTINLSGADQWGIPVSLSTTTNASGFYEFAGLWAGNYTVSETLMSGWLQSYPAAPGTYVIALRAGNNITNNNFGNYQNDVITPGFTLTKDCAEEPVQFGDDAVFDIELANTGNVDLIVVLDEDVVDTLGVIVTAGDTISAGDQFTLPVGQTLQAAVAIPAVTYPSQGNTINALITLPEWTGLSDSWTPTASDSCDVVDSILPGFTLTKVCAEEPVLLGDDAVFNIELANTGNVALIVVLDEDVVDTLGVIVTAGGTISAGAQFTLPVGQTLQATVAIPATTYPFESNTINAHITLPEWTGRTDSWDPTATDSCDVITICSSDTAYGLNDALSPACFNTFGFDNWGWTHGPLAYDGVYTFDLWAGAAQCNTDNGMYAGTVTIVYTGSGAKGYTITYNLEEGFEIVQEQVYIGRDQLPKVKEGNKTIPTVSPGQYYVTKGMHSGYIYIIYHAVVEWCE